MKIAFFSDIHGNKYVLDTFFRSVEEQGIEKMVFCGDVFGYYYHQNEIINIFREKGVIALLGNHDQFFLDILDEKIDLNELILKYGNSYRDIEDKISKQNIDYIRELNPSLELNLEGYRIGVFHGSPSDPLNGRIYPDTEIKDIDLYIAYDYVILGHTHHKLNRIVGTTHILNPGSIGQQRDGKGCSYVILDLDLNEFEFKVIDYELELLLNDIERYDAGNHKLKEVLLRKK